ncbi:MAG: DUF4743 domain-containing protein [Burkholderiales bacterium]|nr:DUF4743 domain-containing protein [Burkholderiales bacterium]
MSATLIYDRIATWRTTIPAFDTRGMVRWTVERDSGGWVSPEVAARMQASELFLPGKFGPVLRDDIGGPISKSQALQAFAINLREAGLVPNWRDELFDFVDEWGRIRFSLERGAFRTLGLRSRAVHINGYCGDDTIWIGRRSRQKQIDAGKLDNFAAGGIASFESPQDTLVRELAEEAGVPAALAMLARPAGIIHARRQEADGLHDEMLYCYDLELPPSFAPVNCDGEVAEFIQVDAITVSGMLEQMTLDAAAVTSEWLGRWLLGET